METPIDEVEADDDVSDSGIFMDVQDGLNNHIHEE